MVYTKSYRRYRAGARKTARMGGIRKGYRGSKYRPMTAGKVKRIIDAELKFRDLGVADQPLPPAGSLQHLSLIAQGDLVNQRNGNWIKPTSLMGTVTIVGNEDATPDLIPQFRIVVVCWKENQALNPIAIDKVMQSADSPHQQFNVQNKGQFKVLWSRTGIISSQQTNPQFSKMYRFYVKPGMKCLYDGEGFKNNQLFIFAYSDTTVNPPTMSFETRLRYTDS